MNRLARFATEFALTLVFCFAAPVASAVNASTTDLTSSINPSDLSQSVTFTATVSGTGTPTGTATFFSNSTPIPGCGNVTLTGGVAACTTGILSAGSDSVTAQYSGDMVNSGSTSLGLIQVVNKANTVTSVVSSVNPSVSGQSVTFTATVAPASPAIGTPTGTVTFLDGSTLLASATLSAGAATLSISTLAVGSHSITATYAPGADPNFNGSTSSTAIPQVVNKANTATTLTSSASPSVSGQIVTFTATVTPVAPATGTPTGMVTFLDGSTLLGTATLSTGVATLSINALGVGSHNITATYAPGADPNFNGSTSSPAIPQVVNKANTATTLTSSASPSVSGQIVTFTATVTPVAPATGTPTGMVTFLDGSTLLGTATLSTGVATLSINTLGVVSHSITAQYGGDANNISSSAAALTQQVNKAMTTTNITPPAAIGLGQSAVMQTSVSVVSPGTGTPTGTIAISDGGAGATDGCTITLPATSCSLTPTNAGNLPVTATYSGDANFLSGTATASLSVAIATSSLTVTASPNPSMAGQAVTFVATVSDTSVASATNLAKALRMTASPTGNVTISDDGTTLTTLALNGTGSATFTTSALGVGSHTIVVNYSGDPNTAASSFTLIQVVTAVVLVTPVPAPALTVELLVLLTLMVATVGVETSRRRLR